VYISYWEIIASLKARIIHQRMPQQEKKQEMERLMDEVRKSLESEQNLRQKTMESLTAAYMRIDEYVLQDVLLLIWW